MENKIVNPRYSDYSIEGVKKADVQNTFFTRFKKSFRKHKYAYLMIVPVLIFYAVFCYTPMYGVIIAFKAYTPSLGIDRKSVV